MLRRGGIVGVTVAAAITMLGAPPAEGAPRPGALEQAPPATGVPKPDVDPQARIEGALAGLETAADASEAGLEVRGGLVKVDVLTRPPATDDAERRVEDLGGRVTQSPKGILEAWVPPAQLESLSTSPSVRFVRRPAEPMPEAVTSEAVGAMRADLLHAQGITGAGMQVGIIDGGFLGYTTRQAQGDLPASLTTYSLCADPITGGDGHGTAVAETAYDLAPQADVFLLCVDSPADLAGAVAYAQINGIDVLIESLSWYNTSRGDGSGGPGTPDAAVEAARNAGIVWVNSAGNRARLHWSGPFNSPDADAIHDWVPGDETNNLSLANNQQICAYLKWDSWPTTSQDYDLYLRRTSDDVAVDFSENFQTGSQPPVEAFCYTNMTGLSQTLYLEIRRFSATQTPRFDLFLHPGPASLQYFVTPGSVTEPASAPETIAAGAICVNTDALEGFSSQGPTIDGRIKPNVVGPDHTSTGTTGTTTPGTCTGGFSGTSASAPNVGGAAVLARQLFPGFTPADIQALFEGAALDLGTPGPDNEFGFGKVDLGPHPDLLISKGGGTFKGDEIYDPSANKQQTQKKKGHKATFTVAIQNDGISSGHVELDAVKSRKVKKVTFKLDGQNITRAVNGRGFVFVLGVQAQLLLKMTVKAKRGEEGLGLGGVRVRDVDLGTSIDFVRGLLKIPG